MTTVFDIQNFINTIAPFDTMEEWDNSGFLIGDASAPVTRCVLSLDATHAVVDFTLGMGAELLLTHHPVIFKGLRQIPAGSVVSELISNHIQVLAAHTCYDKADGGISDCLAELLGLCHLRHPAEFITVGELDAVMSVDDLAELVSGTLECAGLRYTDTDREIKTVAVCGGAGEEFIEAAMEHADCYVTGEVKYHVMLEAAEQNYPLIAAGHYETEYLSFLALKDKLQEAFPDVEFICAPQKNPIMAV